MPAAAGDRAVNVLDRVEPHSRVLAIRIRSMGDCVLTTPALQLLAAHRPDLHIGVAVEPRFAAIYAGLPFVNSILEPSSAAARAFRPRLTVNLHGGSRSAWMTAVSGAPFRAGFTHYRHGFTYNVKIPRAQEILGGGERTVHTAEHVASAMFHLGVPQCTIPAATLHADERPETGYYAVIHPFASNAEKTWPAAKFVEAAELVRKQRKVEPLILAGPGDDLAPFAAYRAYACRPLETVKGLIRHASFFLGNDSGPAHLAAAFDVPMTVVFGPSDPLIWGPWRASNARIVRADATPAEAV